MLKKVTSLLLPFLLSFNLSAFAAEQPEFQLENKEFNLAFDQIERSELRDAKVDPGKAMILSALYFGVGQIYSGDRNRGLLILAGGTIILGTTLIFFLPYINTKHESVKNNGTIIAALINGGYYLWNIRDAFNTAEMVNASIEDKLFLSNLVEQLERIEVAQKSENFELSYQLVRF